MPDDASDQENDLATEVMSASQLPGVTNVDSDGDDLFGSTVSLTNKCPRCGMKFPDETQHCPLDGAVLSEWVGRIDEPAEQEPFLTASDTREEEALDEDSEYDDVGIDTVVLSPEDIEDEDDIRGRVFEGRFRVDAVLGEGGMGRVYKGTQLSVERPVAIKVIHGDISQREDIRQRFMREAQLISSFSHPNTIRLYDFGEAQGHLYIAMEYVDGVSLDRITGKAALNLDFVFEVFEQITGALVEAHQTGVVHRDLKPENVFLTRTADGRLQTKLLDFGIAHVEQPMLSQDGLTKRGAVVGTPEYMAPEQAKGLEVTPATDVYALGVILYEMVTGTLPFESDSQMHTIYMQVSEPVPPVREVCPECPERLAYAIERMLAKDADGRPQSALQVLRAVRKLRSEVGARPIQELAEGEPFQVFWETATRVIERDPAPAKSGPRPSSEPAPESKNRKPARAPAKPDIELADTDEQESLSSRISSTPGMDPGVARQEKEAAARTRLKRTATTPGYDIGTSQPRTQRDPSAGMPAQPEPEANPQRKTVLILAIVIAVIFLVGAIAVLAVAA